MGELANCPNCGELFVKGAQTVCRTCFLEEEEKFETVYSFIRKKKNRTATMGQVSDETGVEKSLIQKWLRQRRIQPGTFPNLTYQCERCDTQIYEGKLCLDCADVLKSDLQQGEVKTIAEKENEKKRQKVYFNVDQENKWRN
ncbi:TIGR03826 family flagellar region protein [Alkalibacillus haloalkaliphilus]|uniref:TIGR03826 family flagellar region protein n=1 Tax=Alkalibacillus haloalkaliphilus TaxID=94136 RepID=UPI0002E73AA5|nr:TIGR03826 family flagellar region protein [Alkalibacillus haloalkaliphilus]